MQGSDMENDFCITNGFNFQNDMELLNIGKLNGYNLDKLTSSVRYLGTIKIK